MPIETDENFRMEIREILQSVEDALIDGGFDHYMVATEHGTFHWETTDRALRAAREPAIAQRHAASTTSIWQREVEPVHGVSKAAKRQGPTFGARRALPSTT